MFTEIWNYVSVPQVEVSKGGILAVANVINPTDPHDLLGAQYLTDACTQARVWTEFCTEPGPSSGTGSKTFDAGPTHVTGEPFAVYAGVECDLQRLTEGSQRASNALLYGEREQIDNYVKDWLDTVDTAIGTSDSIVESIGALEAYAAANYGGVPTLVLPIQAVAWACSQNLIYRNIDGTLETCQGSKVANIVTGDINPIPAGAIPLYVTGQITLIKGPVELHSVTDHLITTSTMAPPRALAERIWVPLVECIIGSIAFTPA